MLIKKYTGEAGASNYRKLKREWGEGFSVKGNFKAADT